MSAAQEHAFNEVERIKPFWINAAGLMEMPPGVLQDYLAAAFCDGGLHVIEDLKTHQKTV